MRINLITAVGAGLAAVALLIHFGHGPWTPLRLAGAAVVLLAMGLLLLARYELGRSFSVQAKARKLVTTGLYSRIRNPIYVSGVLLFLGVAMYLRSWWPLLLELVVIPLQVVRARREAGVLRAAFGEEYEAYRRTTWF